MFSGDRDDAEVVLVSDFEEFYYKGYYIIPTEGVNGDGKNKLFFHLKAPELKDKVSNRQIKDLPEGFEETLYFASETRKALEVFKLKDYFKTADELREKLGKNYILCEREKRRNFGSFVADYDDKLSIARLYKKNEKIPSYWK